MLFALYWQPQQLYHYQGLSVKDHEWRACQPNICSGTYKQQEEGWHPLNKDVYWNVYHIHGGVGVPRTKLIITFVVEQRTVACRIGMLKGTLRLVTQRLLLPCVSKGEPIMYGEGKQWCIGILDSSTAVPKISKHYSQTCLKDGGPCATFNRRIDGNVLTGDNKNPVDFRG